VSWGNFGYGGETHATIYSNAVNYVNNFTPDVLIFPVFSPNDGACTQAILDAAWQRVTALALLCASKNVHFVVTSPVPFVGNPSDSYAQQMISRIKASGYSYLDFYSTLNNPSSPGNELSSYNSGDGHPTDAGYTAMAGLLQILLVQLVARRPTL
jgi:hypothetical protein